MLILLCFGSYAGKSIAANIDLARQGTETNSENVRFNLYLDEQDMNLREKTENINSSDLQLYLSVSVQGGGYLVDPTIEVVESNFKFKNFEETKFKLDSNIQSENGITVGLPIVAKADEVFSLNMLDMPSIIRLTGEYVDAGGNVTDINTEKAVKVTWTAEELTEENILLNQEIITNKIYEIDGEQKRVVQVLVTSKVEGNIAPVKSEKIEIEVPNIGTNPEEVKVAGYSLKATNGKTSKDFSNDMWEYSKEDGKVYINVENVNEENIVSWVKNAEDTFVITYIYDGNQEMVPFISNVKSKLEIYGKQEAVEKEVSVEQEELVDFGDILKVENNIDETIYKGKMYVAEETEFKEEVEVFVSLSNIAENIIVEDLGDVTLTEDEYELEGISTYYKETKINKEEAVNVLGEEGKVTVYNSDNKDMPIKEIELAEETEGNYLTISYEENVNNIEIEMSKPQNEGTIEILNTKAIGVEDLNDVPVASSLSVNKSLLASNTNSNQIVSLNSLRNANLGEPKTTANFDIEYQSIWAPVSEERAVEANRNNAKLKVELVSKDTNNKLFKNPIVKIQMPQEITNVRIEGKSLTNANGLTIKGEPTYNAETRELVVELEGEQTSTSGIPALLEIDTKLITKSVFTGDKKLDVNFVCINDGEQVQGIKQINLESNKELVTRNTITREDYIEGEIKSYTGYNNSPSAVKVNKNSKVAIKSDMINNYGRELSNINLVGTIPQGTVLEGPVTSSTQGVSIAYSEEENPVNWVESVTDYSKVKAFRITLENLANLREMNLEYNLIATLEGIAKDATLTSSVVIDGVVNRQAKKQTIEFKMNAGEGGENPSNPQQPEQPEQPSNPEQPAETPGRITATMVADTFEPDEATEGETITYIVRIKNNTNETMNNLKITSKVPEGTVWVENSTANEDWQYSKETNTIERTINTLNAGEEKELEFEVKVNGMDKEPYEITIENSAVVTISEQEKYETNKNTIKAKFSKLEIHMTSEHQEKLYEGDNVKYIITVKNIGKDDAYIHFEDELPEEIAFRKLTYYTNEKNKTEDIVTKKKVSFYTPVNAGETLTVIIEGITYELEDSVPSKKISNVAKIPLGNDEYLESEKIVNTIINDIRPENPDEEEGYSISGQVWKDENKNGIKEETEKAVEPIEVILLNKQGKEVAKTTSTVLGTYKFSGLEEGEYTVVFNYNVNKYAVTKYQVEGAKQHNNSDAITKAITLNGENKTVGITDTIKITNQDIENIDLGLIENAKFDLRLDKYVTKVVVTNKEGTATYNFENTSLAKVEIGGKNFAGTVLLVEYDIKITNEGDVPAYVTDIIDYLPKELDFSSEMNKEWYVGTDNNLHYMEVDTKEIAPGESKTVKLALTKTLKTNSAGTIANTAEIGESANLFGITELDSVAGNKASGEDDISTAELIVSIRTGGAGMYIGIVIASMLILGIGIYLINKKVLKVRI